MAHDIAVPVSCGELIDKITILEIKRSRITDAANRRNVEAEHAALTRVLEDAFSAQMPVIAPLMARLAAVNLTLWVIEDDIRACERTKDFGPAFVALARAVYRTNDERAAIKREIDVALGSVLREEKSYAPYS